MSRRGLIGGLAAAGTTAIGVAAAATAHAEAPSDAPSGSPAAASSYPFEGVHQQGVVTPKQSHAAFVAFDVTATGHGELVGLLRTITRETRILTAGGTPPSEGLLGTDVDDGVLGATPPADGLTVTASVGASLFDHRFGLAARRPRHLRRMDEFPNDALDRAACDGDLLLQICADHSDAVVHALRQLTRATRGQMQVRWRMSGWSSPPRPSGSSRNLLGYKDGTANPDVTDTDLMDQLVWTRGGQDGEPGWVDGGSYHVVRVIRMFVEFWDRVSVREQNNIFGRDKVTGAPLTGTHELDTPDFTADPTQDVILSNAHIRLANPRTPGTEDQRILRRSFNYDLGTDANGDLDMGHLFVAFNQDLDRQFVTIQRRLADEPLVDYVSPVGGGYFFALPGVRDSSDWLGRGLLA
ncbi:MAG: iron uptake transporter deferrochelatase/peroxidase subunit [Nocardioidaceae bacterium]|nr:iron uptake transporter deferrochelatase/peroxidase subunit [Nocardioidaceae bacterium]MCL2613721.1 iron uptake transporter deferrochelatase/peroxidase subunit [Nocardioidaceae bacterium]